MPMVFGRLKVRAGQGRFTLPKTNSSPLKMDGWNTTFLLGRLIFRGYVSFREGTKQQKKQTKLVARVWKNILGFVFVGDFLRILPW